MQAEHSGQPVFRELLQRYHCQLTRCENTSKVCVSKGARHFMFSREAPKLWNDAIMAGEAITHSFPASLFHLLTVQELNIDRGRRSTRQQDSSPTPSRSHTPAAPAPTIVFAPSPAPAPYYGLPQMPPGMTQHYFPPLPAPGSRLEPTCTRGSPRYRPIYPVI
jgi:hypothetical protein